MRVFLGALRDRGVPAVHLVMSTANTPAGAFYDRMGFHALKAPMDVSETCLGRSIRDLGRL